MKPNIILLLNLTLILLLSITACAKYTATPPIIEPTTIPTDPIVVNTPTIGFTIEPTQTIPMDEDIQGPLDFLGPVARAEGTLVTYGMPADWENETGLLALVTKNHGIPHDNRQMYSAEILTTLRSETAAPIADIALVDLSQVTTVNDESLSQIYRNFYMDDIPDYAKDESGRWSGVSWGAIAFTVNADLISSIPQTWIDLLKPEYKDQICMGDPRESATAKWVVLASAYANGGSETNPQPGLDYFKQLIDAGQIRPMAPDRSTIENGDCPVSLMWDYDGLLMKKDLGKNLVIVIPSGGTAAGVDIQFITLNAPHPNAARLLVELVYSDEGQLAIARGFRHPIRKSVQIPEDWQTQFPPLNTYRSVVFPKDYTALAEAMEKISEGWGLIIK